MQCMLGYRFIMLEIFFAGQNDNTENALDGTKRDRLLPDLCVICLEQEYNAVFVP